MFEKSEKREKAHEPETIPSARKETTKNTNALIFNKFHQITRHTIIMLDKSSSYNEELKSHPGTL